MGGVICSDSEMFGLSEKKKLYLCKYSFRIYSHKAKHPSFNFELFFSVVFFNFFWVAMQEDGNVENITHCIVRK